MPHRLTRRIVRLAASALCALALATVMLAPLPAPRAFAQTPPTDGGTSTAAPEPTGDAGGGASSGDTGATSGSTTSGSGGTTSTGGDGTSSGGGSGSGSTATTTGGDAGAAGGTGSTSDSGSATSGNTASTGSTGGTTAPPEGAVTTSNATQQGSGGATGTGGTGTGSPAPSGTATSGTEASAPAPSGTATSGSATTATADGTSGAAAAPSTTSASTGDGTTAANSASASSGAATAIGNLSTTDIVQMVIAIVNIVMPNVDPSQFTMPLVSITQNATVTNIGNAMANTGNNSAVVNVLSSIAQQAGMTTTQLAGIVSAQASTVSGGATAIGNVTWSDISQLTSVIVSVNGDTSHTAQLTSVTQSAQVSNEGSASANTGGNTSTVTVQTQSASDGTATTTVTQTDDAVSAPAEDVPDDGTNSDKPVLYWGPANGPKTLVWLYVDGILCKSAETSADPDFAGRFVWEAKLAPRECNVYRGARVSFIVVNPAQQTVIWDNLIRESPELRLLTPEGVLGSAAVKTR